MNGFSKIIEYLSDRRLQPSFKGESLRRARDYNPDSIIVRLPDDLSGGA